MRFFRSVVILLPLLTVAQAQNPAATPSELRAARAFEAAKKSGAPQLYAFLKPFPKGADLHMHLSGAIYAETFIAEAIKQGLCVSSTPPPCIADPDSHSDDKTKSCPLPTLDAKHIATPLTFAKPDKGTCALGQMTVADAVNVQAIYDAMIDSFSMRSFVPSAGWSGHDQFFATFDRFSGLQNAQGDWLDEVAYRAAAQNEQYLEIMQTPSFDHAAAAGYKLGWPADFNDTNHMEKLAQLRTSLLDSGLRDDIAIDQKQLADAKARRAEIENCATYEKFQQEEKQSPDVPFSHGQIMQMEDAGDTSGCSVKIHWLYQVLRGFPPQQVFAQTLLGFELAAADPDVVGINFVRAEDWRGPMAEYHTEMLMMDYLHSVYPRVRISLHAGELAPGMVTPDGLTFHIREALDLGHAERIGHGVDVLYEDNVKDNGLIKENLTPLLKEMAAKHIMVEVNLTSNDVILGIKGTDHPLAAYRAAHVPWALSTDDEGVSRIDLTHEYVKGALEQNLSYADLKQSARTALEHSFLPGESLWAAPDNFTRRKPVCAGQITATSKLSPACAKLLDTSERATQQYELERRFTVFESRTF
jgi:adenosine deaminase